MATTKKTAKESIDETEKRYSKFVEETKLTNDYLKHIATLDTGLLIIIATFLEKFTGGQIITTTYVFLSVTFLAISLVSLVASQLLLVFALSRFTDAKHTDEVNQIYSSLKRSWDRFLTAAAYIGFILALLFLTLYVTNGLLK